jgi:hypothetical protein
MRRTLQIKQEGFFYYQQIEGLPWHRPRTPVKDAGVDGWCAQHPCGVVPDQKHRNSTEDLIDLEKN